MADSCAQEAWVKYRLGGHQVWIIDFNDGKVSWRLAGNWIKAD